MKSTIGRPRSLTEKQIKLIRAWHVRYLVWRALRRTVKTQREIAQEFGVSQSTVNRIIRRGADYKRGFPEVRD
jgi:DNA-binding MarR family transcriptional regulator